VNARCSAHKANLTCLWSPSLPSC